MARAGVVEQVECTGCVVMNMSATCVVCTKLAIPRPAGTQRRLHHKTPLFEFCPAQGLYRLPTRIYFAVRQKLPFTVRKALNSNSLTRDTRTSVPSNILYPARGKRIGNGAQGTRGGLVDLWNASARLKRASDRNFLCYFLSLASPKPRKSTTFSQLD
ncbi:hypothetical protein E2C01_059152 [Portunus trituberculatus]|uniref:Uncharacterized protein n=1 Tax=Portunus trituberculatus TaxID=210409 RepID=A0A5B7H7K2_PORTR|nr:hypothetical protein [Portunus trituberculatus]